MVKTWVKMGMGCVLLWAGVASAQETSEPEARAGYQSCDRAEIDQLESEALALAAPGGCEDVGQCRSAPVGAKACGGPRSHVVYCATSTDEDRLLKALERLEKREGQFNQQCDVFSTCEFISPPELELVEGQCRAVTPS
ncbi:hypothetical protein [Archangium lipolyticum]|uniref:hypothetical protein n=1 Tax=Archangium lipolyticum TaxID=2970465 RepID=UPI00214A6FCD|nr:hypothetical protein [Archangium lipolyticum]